MTSDTLRQIIKAGPGRPRNPETHAAILASVASLLREGGYPAVSIEAVAGRAGVGKQTIYRWWPGKAELVLEHLVALAATMPAPDTGDMVTDLRIYLLATCRAWVDDGTGAVVAALMAEAQVNPIFAQRFFQQLIGHRRTALREVLRRGQERGALTSGAESRSPA